MFQCFFPHCSPTRLHEDVNAILKTVIKLNYIGEIYIILSINLVPTKITVAARPVVNEEGGGALRTRTLTPQLRKTSF